MKFSRGITLACVVALAAVVVTATAFGGAKAPATQKASFTAALVSDIGKFTDKGFNQNQLKGLNDGEGEAGRRHAGSAVELDERLRAELQHGDPQGREARHRGRLPARADRGDVREEVPERQLRDHRLHGAHRAVRRQEGQGPAGVQERRGPDVHGERVGLPRRRARGEDGAKKGGNAVGAVGGLKIPPVDIWIAGYKYCVHKIAPG